MEKRVFGASSAGVETSLYIFQNRNGKVMQVTDFGATLQAVKVPDERKTLVDVVLGYDCAKGYEWGCERSII